MYSVVWSLETPEGNKRKLVSAPEAIESEDVDSAKKEGRMVLAELAPENKLALKPLSVVEISEDMKYGLSGCERIYLTNCDDDGELEFVDVTDTSYWTSQPWWHK